MAAIQRRLVVALVATALVAGVTPAHAVQLDPRDRPNVSGPLSLAEEKCTKETRKLHGKVIAVFRLCQYLYTFDPAKETNEAKDFGALWVQTSVNSKRGWCTRSVRNNLRLPDNGILSKAPKPGLDREFDSKESFKTKLVVDGRDDTDTPGRIKNSYVVRPGNLKAIHKGGRNLYRLRWRGNTEATTAFALAVELSWDEGSASPLVNPGVAGEFLKDTC